MKTKKSVLILVLFFGYPVYSAEGAISTFPTFGGSSSTPQTSPLPSFGKPEGTPSTGTTLPSFGSSRETPQAGAPSGTSQLPSFGSPGVTQQGTTQGTFHSAVVTDPYTPTVTPPSTQDSGPRVHIVANSDIMWVTVIFWARPGKGYFVVSSPDSGKPRLEWEAAARVESAVGGPLTVSLPMQVGAPEFFSVREE